MKKILFPIVFSIVVVLLTGLAAYAGPAEDQQRAYIMQSFDIVGQEFYQRAEREYSPDGGMLLVLSDETDPKTHYYLGLVVNGGGIITLAYASVQTELANNVVEISNEGLTINYEIKDYDYYIERKLVFRNENCRVEKMEPKEGVWDTVLGKLFLNNSPE